jgi:RNA polymerase sigma-70 factor (ECF subfamily)
VLAVVYLIFNKGYAATSGERLVRDELCAEAIRLGRVLVELMPNGPEAVGLPALMLLLEARRPARATAEGALVPLADQDRSLWNRGLIAEGQAMVRDCLRRNQPGPYQIQAALNAVHADAAPAAETDWWQILQLYNQLLMIAPNPIVAVNRAVAVAEVEGPDAALTSLDGLDLENYYLFHAVRADMLRRLGRDDKAATAYDAAIARTNNLTEREYMQRRLGGLAPAE